MEQEQVVPAGKAYMIYEGKVLFFEEQFIIHKLGLGSTVEARTPRSSLAMTE